MSVIEKLDSVVKLCDAASAMVPSPECVAAIKQAETAAADFVVEHGPAIRQAMIDARRYRFIRLRLWPSDVDEILDEYPAGTNFYDSVEDAAKRIDAAIDAARATGEGEGNG